MLKDSEHHHVPSNCYHELGDKKSPKHFIACMSIKIIEHITQIYVLSVDFVCIYYSTDVLCAL